MAKTLRDHINEAEAWVNSPAVGDDFAINIREECLVESHIVDVVEDGVVLAADDRMMRILESYGLLEAADPYRREVSPPSPEEFEEGMAEDFGTDPTQPGTWHGHKIVANRRTPKGDFLILQNKNDGKYEIHKQNPGFTGGLEFISVHKTPEEMQTAFRQLTGVNEANQGVAEGSTKAASKDDDKFYVVSSQGIEHGPFKTREQANAKKAKAPAYGYKVVTGKQARRLFDDDVMEDSDHSVDNLLSLMRKAMAGIDASSGYSDQGRDDIRKIYNGLRRPLMRGSMGDFEHMWMRAGATAPDAFDAFADQLFAAAGLPEGSTYDEFIQSLNSMQESSQELHRIQELAGMPPMAMPAVNEGSMKRKIDDLYYDFQETNTLPPDVDDDTYLAAVAKFLSSQDIGPEYHEDIGELFIDMRDHAEDDHDYANAVDAEQYDDEDMMEGAAPEIDYDSLEVDGIDTSDYPDFSDAYFSSGEYVDGTPIPGEVLDDLARDGDLLRHYIDRRLYEAKYQGREVPLGKPFLTPDGPKKRSVYVKNPKGNVVKVNFGDKKLRIKKSNPKRRKSFRARHNCANPGPRHKARYWSCRAW